tara:strand:- start:1573 stop:2598 length:1026 start_codon:yes stop_codon:yes gene_type:complete
MGLIFALIVLSFFSLILINTSWAITNLYFFIVEGVQTVIVGSTFAENIYFSNYLKWIILFDTLWISIFLIFLFNRKNFMTDSNLHYLDYRPILEPKVCVVIPAYNEELVIEQTIKDFLKQKNVEHVIVIDNHSDDQTANLAKKSGALVITKNQNMGYAHSWLVGFRESLKTDANVTVVCDADGTFNAYDLDKMIPYLDNCDMVIGNRMVQILSEKDNQNSIFLVWGNAFIAKLLQIKYFSIRHLGIIQVNDAGCSYRCIRNESLKLIIDDFVDPVSDNLLFGANSITIGMFTTAKVIEHYLKIVEIPITFRKRVGTSKTQATKKLFALKYGLNMIWYIIKS